MLGPGGRARAGDQGYWCGEAARTPREHACGGDGVYCPRGAARPLPVAAGFESVGGDNYTVRAAQAACPVGSYCRGGVRRECPAGRFGRASRLDDAACSGLCARGHYCLAGASYTRHTHVIYTSYALGPLRPRPLLPRRRETTPSFALLAARRTHTLGALDGYGV